MTAYHDLTFTLYEQWGEQLRPIQTHFKDEVVADQMRRQCPDTGWVKVRPRSPYDKRECWVPGDKWLNHRTRRKILSDLHREWGLHDDRLTRAS